MLKLNLAGRKIVDLRGPYGWKFAAVNTGRLQLLPELGDPDLNVGLRRVQPLVELRVPIKLSQMELDSVARGAEDPDLSAVVRAAEKLARAEDNTIFNGLAAGGHHRHPARQPAPAPSRCRRTWPACPARCWLPGRPCARPASGARTSWCWGRSSTTRSAPRCTRAIRWPSSWSSWSIGPLVRAVAIDAAVVLSVRGGDFELWVGQDLSIGYAHHDKDHVELYLTESLTFRVLEPAAAVPLLAAPLRASASYVTGWSRAAG